MDLTSLLESYYSKMTVKERAVTDKLLENLEPLISLSAKDAANYYQTSPATLVRLAQHVGLSGYSELSIEAKNFFNSRKEKSSTAKNNAFRSMITSFEEAIKAIDYENNEKNLTYIAKEMTSAKRIFALGVGHTGLAADYLKYLFLRENLIIISANDQPTVGAIDRVIVPGDFVIIFSATGSENIYHKIYKKCQKENIKFALITMNPNTKYFEIADYTCVLPTVSVINNNSVSSMDSRPLFFVLMSCLESLYKTYNKK